MLTCDLSSGTADLTLRDRREVGPPVHVVRPRPRSGSTAGRQINTMPTVTEATVRAWNEIKKTDAEERCMRAWQVIKHGEPKDVMELGDKAIPEPGPGEVRILVKAAALGLPDVFMCRGTYAFNPAIPFTPGQEVVGIVTAAGEGVDLGLRSRVIATTSFIQGNGGLPSRPLHRSVRHIVFRIICLMRTRPPS